ncbi:MAG TPA: hypothetical protein VF773_13745 [Verrucomicrobiae bacterium]
MAITTLQGAIIDGSSFNSSTGSGVFVVRDGSAGIVVIKKGDVLQNIGALPIQHPVVDLYSSDATEFVAIKVSVLAEKGRTPTIFRALVVVDTLNCNFAKVPLRLIEEKPSVDKVFVSRVFGFARDGESLVALIGAYNQIHDQQTPPFTHSVTYHLAQIERVSGKIQIVEDWDS